MHILFIAISLYSKANLTASQILCTGDLDLELTWAGAAGSTGAAGAAATASPWVTLPWTASPFGTSAGAAAGSLGVTAAGGFCWPNSNFAGLA